MSYYDLGVVAMEQVIRNTYDKVCHENDVCLVTKNLSTGKVPRLMVYPTNQRRCAIVAKQEPQKVVGYFDHRISFADFKNEIEYELGEKK